MSCFSNCCSDSNDDLLYEYFNRKSQFLSFLLSQHVWRKECDVSKNATSVFTSFELLRVQKVVFKMMSVICTVIYKPKRIKNNAGFYLYLGTFLNILIYQNFRVAVIKKKKKVTIFSKLTQNKFNQFSFKCTV